MKSIRQIFWIVCLMLGFLIYGGMTSKYAYADIATDGSLGRAVELQGPDFKISAELGKQAGGNLFHSFQKFNINTGESAAFSGPGSVENIISRVTGGTGSWIDGLLRSEITGANMYFLNPCGVMFGPNAFLDISGSFHVSTADYLKFGEDRFYSVPMENDVLSVAKPSAFGFVDDNPAPITFKGSGSQFVKDQGINGIQVPEHETISIIGGNITVTSAELPDAGNVETIIKAPNGRIDIASTASPGEVIPTESSLETSSFTRMGNIEINNGAYVTVTGEGAGSIHIRGGKFVLDNWDTSVLAGSLGDGNGGGIDIKLDDDLVIKNDAGIYSNGFGAGTGRKISIEAQNVEMSNGGGIIAGVNGSGKGADVEITAKESILITGESEAGISAVALNTLADGDAGRLDIKTNSLTVSDNAAISGETAYGSTGNGAEISIQVEKLEIESGGFINHGSYGTGKGSDLFINAEKSVTISDQESSISSQTKVDGDAGNLSIYTSDMTIKNGGRIAYESFGKGHGGNIDIHCDSFEMIGGGGEDVKNRCIVSSSAHYTGNGGDISITASDHVTIDGNSGYNTAIASMSLISEGGDIVISTPSLTLKNSAMIQVATYEGKAGNIEINSQKVLINGGLLDAGYYGKISSNSVEDHFETYGIPSSETGTAGSIIVKAEDSVILEGQVKWDELIAEGQKNFQPSNITTYNVGGNPGKIEIITGELILTKASMISTTGSSGGDSGKIDIYADQIELENGGKISSHSSNLEIRDGEVVVGNTFSGGRGGDINLNVQEKLSIMDNGEISSQTSERGGDAGDITICSPLLTLSNGRISVYTEGTGNAGELNISGKELLLTRGGIINGSTSNQGSGGSIDINVEELTIDGGIIFSGANEGSSGQGGNIDIQTETLRLSDNSLISSESESTGKAGNVTINVKDKLKIDNASIKTSTQESDGGDVIINAGKTLYVHDGAITTSVQGGEGNGGNITINPSEFVVLNNGDIIANAYGGDGGNIRIVSDHFIQSPESIVRASSELGISGSVEIESPDTDLGYGLNVLPSNLMDVSYWLKTPCKSRSGEDISYFILSPRDALPLYPKEWIPSPPPVSEMPELMDVYQRGDFEKLAKTCLSIMENIEPADDPESYAYAALYLAHAVHRTGHFKIGISAIDRVLDILEKKNSIKLLTLCLSARGRLYLYGTKTDQAKQDFGKAKKLADSENDTFLLAHILNNMGNMSAMEWDAKSVKEGSRSGKRSITIVRQPDDILIENYKKCEEIAADSESEELKSLVLINSTRLKLRVKGSDNSDMFESVLSRIKGSPNAHFKAWHLIALGCMALDTEQGKNTAWQAFQEASRISEDLGDIRSVSLSLGFMGRLYEIQKEYSKALEITRSAVFAAQQGNYPEILYRWQWQLGRLFAHLGDMERAIEQYSEALKVLEPIRIEFYNTYRREQYFSEEIRPLYLELASLFLEKENFIKAIDTMEKFKTIELQDFFRDECVAETDKKGLDDIISDIPQRSAVFYPILFSDRVVILLILPDGLMKKFDIPVGINDLNNTIDRFAASLRKQIDVKADGEKLYQWIVHPLETELTIMDVDTIIIIPDGALRLIPFSAMYDGNRYLVEKYAVITAPAISLTGMGTTHIKPLALLGGLSESRDGFSALPNVEKELKNVKEVTHGKLLFNHTYTKDNLFSEFKNQTYSQVLFSSHGVFGNSPEDTFLLTYDGKLTLKNIEDLINLGRFREDRVELLTLSACETALGDERAALGMGGIAVKAGVKSAIATLWKVNDESTSTAILILTFFLKKFSNAAHFLSSKNNPHSTIQTKNSF